MSKETKKWWEYSSQSYQKESKIPVDIHYGPGAPNEKELKLLGNLKGKRVLEIGCGGAQCGIAMAKKGAKVTGIDISNEQLKFAKALAEKNKVKINLYQGDIVSLKQIKSNSQDIVFTAWALHYVGNLEKCFGEVYRVLKKGGIFVLSTPHPFYDTINSKTLKIIRSYFNNGKHTEVYSDKTKKFVFYDHTFSDITNAIVNSGLIIEKVIEPDSRKRYKGDPWYGVWDFNSKMMSYFPPTIIFKVKKKK
jgi:2-polyprenyl-3-methyl-5-hydroxy-6-metoxy-1,4-benzoquinol methylase